jgi:hypothetical protein
MPTDKMNVYIPVAIGQHIPGEVLSSLRSQTIPVNIISIGTLGIINSSRVSGKSIHIARTREVIARLARTTGEISAMCDSDVVHLMKDNLELAEMFLKKHPECGAVAFRPSKSKSHILIQGVTVSPEAWEVANFSNGDECNCRSFEKSIAPCFSIVYLDDKVRIKEVQRPHETSVAIDALKGKIWDLDHYPNAWKSERDDMVPALQEAIYILEKGAGNVDR